MTDTELFQNIATACREFGRALAKAIEEFFASLRKAFSFLYERMEETLKHYQDLIERQKAVPHQPPVLAPTPIKSQAYYSKPYIHRFKHAFRQERTWKHQG